MSSDKVNIGDEPGQEEDLVTAEKPERDVVQQQEVEQQTLADLACAVLDVLREREHENDVADEVEGGPEDCAAASGPSSTPNNYMMKSAKKLVYNQVLPATVATAKAATDVAQSLWRSRLGLLVRGAVPCAISDRVTRTVEVGQQHVLSQLLVEMHALAAEAELCSSCEGGVGGQQRLPVTSSSLSRTRSVSSRLTDVVSETLLQILSPSPSGGPSATTSSSSDHEYVGIGDSAESDSFLYRRMLDCLEEHRNSLQVDVASSEQLSTKLNAVDDIEERRASAPAAHSSHDH